MKITSEGVVTLVTNLVGIATMVFGMSRDTADVITKAAPTIVGGIMSAATVVTYLINKRKERTAVFNAVVSAKADGLVQAAGLEDSIVATAKRIGMI